MTAPSPRPTRIAGTMSRPARPGFLAGVGTRSGPTDSVVETGTSTCVVLGSRGDGSAVAGSGTGSGAVRSSVTARGGSGGGGGAGRRPTSGIGPVSGSGVMAGGPDGSHLEELGLLVLDRLVDAVHVLGGQVVELLLRAAHVVLAGLAVLGDAVELLLGAAAHVADGDLGVLALGAGLLDQVAAALLGQLREDDADDLAVVGRVDAEVAVADGLLDGRQLAGVVGLDDRHARLGHGDRRHLRHRRRGAVVVDQDLVEHRGGGPSGAHRAEVLPSDRQGLVHPLLGVEQGVVDQRRCPSCGSGAGAPPVSRPVCWSAVPVERSYSGWLISVPIF